MRKISQGDILKVDGIRYPLLVVSKDFFHQTSQVIACPIRTDIEESALHIAVKGNRTEGIVQCEDLRLLDIGRRGYRQTDRITIYEIMDITDAIQSIFDYV